MTGWHRKRTRSGLLLPSLFLALLSLSPQRAEALLVEVIPGSHYQLFEWYSTEEQALQACHNFAESHGYSGTSVCLPFCCDSETNLPAYVAGWLWAENGVQKTPFTFGHFYYNTECDAGFVLDNDSGNCVCQDDASCSDGLVCNGEELCDLATGVCVTGTPLECSDPDGLVCTPGLCVEPEGCVSEPGDPTLCSCDVLPTPEVQLTLPALQIDELSIPCPFVGGTAGASLGVSGTYTHQHPDCTNDCTSQDSAQVNVNVAAKFCSKGDAKENEVGLTGSYTRLEQGCLRCEDGSCEQTCDEGGCVTQTYSGGVSMSLSKSFALSLGPKRIFGSDWRVFCGAQVTGSVGVTGSKQETNGTLECGECTECSSLNFDSSLSGSAAATCRVTGSVFGQLVNVGLQDLGKIEASVSGINSLDCDGNYCGIAAANVKAGVRIPLSATRSRWWGLRGGRELACTATWKGCAESNSCGSCSTCPNCLEQDAVLSCGVFATEQGAE